MKRKYPSDVSREQFEKLGIPFTPVAARAGACSRDAMIRYLETAIDGPLGCISDTAMI